MPEYASDENVVIASGNLQIVAVLNRGCRDNTVAEARQRAAVLLHGRPGSEKNVDIARRLQEMGWYTLIVHFRGSWGSGGDYDMTTQPDDALAAVGYLRAEVASVDPARIALIGYSLGSRAAIVAAHRDAQIGAVVSIAGIADYEELMDSPEANERDAPFLHHATPQSLNRQWMRLGGAENPVAIIGQLAQPVLIVHGTEDDVVPYYMAPVLAQGAGQHATLITIEGADHTYEAHRQALVEAVTGWLGSWASGSTGAALKADG